MIVNGHVCSSVAIGRRISVPTGTERECAMRYEEMLEHAKMSCRAFARDNKVSVVYQLSFEDKAIISNLLLGGGTVCDEDGPLMEWTAEMTWRNAEFFLTVVPHTGQRRHIPLPWVTPWNRTARRMWAAHCYRRSSVLTMLDPNW